MSSICGQVTGLDDKTYWEGFSRSVLHQRVPFSGSLALTHRCNLRCPHCYARGENQEQAASELDTAQWRRIIGEIKDAGCLYLLLTGGEPRLRDDFLESYSLAKRIGFLVTVFTNGTLISDRVLGLFRELPPRLVEISLYGASAETHDRVTGVPGSFGRTHQGIERLLGQGVEVGLKSVLMTLNRDEFSAMGEFARGLGVKFRVDAAIFPTLAGDPGPIDLRVSPEQAVAVEMADPQRAREWREYADNFRLVPYGGMAFACSAGRTNFHVDPDGMLYPCLVVRSFRYSLRTGSFAHGWDHEIARIREESAAPGFRCARCDKRLLCGFCPGFFELEHGRSQVPSDYLCAVGELRHEYISNMRSGG